MIFTFYLVVKRLMIRENSVVKIQTIVNQSPALVHSCCIYSMPIFSWFLILCCYLLRKVGRMWETQKVLTILHLELCNNNTYV